MSSPTLSELAAKIGLDKSTISRALRNDPRVKASTRERIQQLAEKLGYVPDPVLSGLGKRGSKSAKRSGIPGAVLIDTHPDEPVLVGDANLTANLIEEAKKRGYALQPVYRSDYTDVAALEKHLLTHDLRRLIVAWSVRSTPLQELDFSKFIAVGLHQGSNDCRLHVVESDYYGMVEHAWKKAVSYGYRRIGAVLFRHPVEVRDDLKRESAVEHRQRTMPAADRIPPYNYSGWFDLAGLDAWMQTHRPDCLIAFNDMAMHQLRMNGWSFPEDCGYISLHLLHKGTELAGLEYQGLHEVHATLNLLDYAVKTNQWGIPHPPIIHQVCPEWVDGATLPRRL